MPWPKGLKFTDRRAQDADTFYFDCTRSGHPPGTRRTKRAFDSRRSRENYITRHDAKYHDETLAAQLGIQHGPTLGEGVGDFMQHIRDLAAKGRRDPKTVRYYDGICKKLLAVFGSETPLKSIGRRAGLAYAKERGKTSTSQGDRFVKELKAVRRIQKFMDVGVLWTLPTEDIDPQHETREPIPLEDVREFIGAMAPESLERAFAVTKFITGIRNEELYAAVVGDVDLDAHELAYWLRNKQTGEKVRHVTYLPDVLLPLLAAQMEDRAADAPLFSIDGVEHLTESSLRKRFINASKKATDERRKIDPEAEAVDITAIGQFRHECATLAMDALQNVYAVQEHLHHRDPKTTMRYKLRKKPVATAASKAVTTTAASKLVN